MAQVESDIVPGNVRDMVNRLSRDMTNRAPFSVHQQIDRRPLPTISAQPPVQLFVATYAYSSKQEDELSFVAGDIIELINEVEDGWSRGKLKSNGTIGMFPTNFVAPKVVPTTPPSTTTAATATNSATATTSAARPKTGNSEVVMRAEPKAIDRTPSTIISEQPSVLKTTEPKYSNVSTVLPSSASSEISSTDSLKMKEMARVKFVYVPQHDDELALRDIDMLLNITTKNCGDAGWFEGELNGKKGLFPDNFVELVQVPVGTESGAKYSSVSRATALNLSHKPPPMNPPQPAVPPKPSKVATTDPIPSTILPASQAPIVPVATTSTNNMPSVNASKNNNFAALREKMSNNLKVVAPEKVASIQQKPTEPRDRSSTIESSNGETPIDNNSSGDQVTELQHITKNRARPPKNRPMSMVMNRHRSSDESPTGRLSSPTSVSTINAMSASMFVAPATKDILIPSNSTSSSPFKTSSAAPATVAPPSSASKPALRPIASNNFTEHHDSSVIKKLASPESGKSPDFSSSSVYVSRSEYDDLLDRFRALEARVIALEKLRS